MLIIYFHFQHSTHQVYFKNNLFSDNDINTFDIFLFFFFILFIIYIFPLIIWLQIFVFLHFISYLNYSNCFGLILYIYLNRTYFFHNYIKSTLSCLSIYKNIFIHFLFNILSKQTKKQKLLCICFKSLFFLRLILKHKTFPNYTKN